MGVLAHAIFHFAPRVLSIFFRLVNFKSFKQRVRLFGKQPQFPRFTFIG